MLAVFALFSCKEASEGDQKIDLQLNAATLTMQLPGSKQLSVVGPEKYVDKANMVWVSLMPSVASVDQTGKVIALGPGETEIYGYVKGLNAVRGVCKVIVKADLDTKLEFVNPPQTINAGEKVVLDYIYTPAVPKEASAVNIICSDSIGRKIVSVEMNVDKDGLVVPGKLTLKALSVGTVNVKVQNKFDSKVNASFEITVNAVPMTSFAFKAGATQNIEAGESLPLKYEILPEAAAYRTVSWRSSDPKLVSVDQKGVLTAGDKIGVSATIYASTDDGNVISCSVSVIKNTMQKVKFILDTVDVVIDSQSSILVPLKIIATPSQGLNYTIYKSTNYVPGQNYSWGQKAGLFVRDNEVFALYNVTQTGSDCIVVEATTAEGNKVRDTCIVNVVDVSDNLLTCKPTYSSTDLGKKTTFQARIANFTSEDAVLKEVELYTRKLVDGVVVKKVIQTKAGLNIEVKNVSGNQNANFVSVLFAPLSDVTVGNVGTYFVRYKYTLSNSNVTNYVDRKTVVDNGAPFSL